MMMLRGCSNECQFWQTPRWFACCLMLTGLFSKQQASAFSSFSSPITGQLGPESRLMAAVKETTSLSRRQWIAGGLVGISNVAILHPLAAQADVTNKVASSSALRTLKAAQKQLNSMELNVVDSDYEGLRQAVRVAPFSEVRKSCSVLLRGGEDGPDAQALVDSYQKFIRSLELMDGTALLGMRGRTIPPEQLLGKYKSTVVSFSEFLKVAEESATIPLQETADVPSA